MLKFWLWLAELPGLTNQTRLALLRHFASPEDLYYADPAEILLTEGITRQQAELLQDHDLSGADQILADCQRMGLGLVTMQDAAYPGRLKCIYDPPLLLYTRGRLPVFDEEAAIAVVGTRGCTPYGETCAEQLGYGLARGGALVISGLARGIDTAATKGALRAGGRPVCVVGNGLDVAYPPENRSLYDSVAAAGVLISEYPPGAEPLRGHFPARNRIMSGLSVATLVVEAPERSGALITAGAALEQGRDVFAVPGPINAPASVGCNRLIRDGAGLVSAAEDILQEYEARFPDKLRPGRMTPAPSEPLPGGQPWQAAEEKPKPKPVLCLTDSSLHLSDDQVLLLRALPENEPIQVDELIQQTGLPTRRVLAALTLLEIDQLADQHTGKCYTRTVTLAEE